jgi:hypothetical protein
MPHQRSTKPKLSQSRKSRTRIAVRQGPPALRGRGQASPAAAEISVGHHRDIDDEATVKKKKEKALAEHVARHPEDVGLTVEDFNWILYEIVRSFIPQR